LIQQLKKKIVDAQKFRLPTWVIEIFLLLNWGIGKFQSLIVVIESWWPNFSGNA
jgi:hypothetical protein